MIDPACGSGHFLLGSFRRILERWRKKEPKANPRDLIQRTLDSIHGVDVNPYAVAIARFRLLLMAMQAEGIKRLADAPAYRIHLAVGDSLMHGRPGGDQLSLGLRDVDHVYHAEDRPLLQQLLAPTSEATSASLQRRPIQEQEELQRLQDLADQQLEELDTLMLQDVARMEASAHEILRAGQ